jgi:hypothetical protein
MVDAILKTLKSLEKDVDSVEFLRIVQSKCILTDALHDHQTPQVDIFPHDKVIIHKK